MSIYAQVTDAVAQMRERGVVIVETLITDQRLLRARRDVDELLEEAALQKKVLKARSPLECATITLKNLRGSMQFAYYMTKDVVAGKGPGDIDQDDDLYPLPRPHPLLAVNTLLALDNFKEKTGTPVVVPESHKWVASVVQKSDYQVGEISVGSLLLLGGAIWHNSGSNTTQNQRRRAPNAYSIPLGVRPLGGLYLGLTTSEYEDLSPDPQAIV